MDIDSSQSSSQSTNQSINQSIYEFLDRGHSTASYNPLTQAEYANHYLNTGVPIVFDLGTYEFRAGFANDKPINQSTHQSINRSTNQSTNQSISQSSEFDDRAPRLRFRPFVGKSKSTKSSTDESSQTVKVANQLSLDESAKLRARTPFDLSSNQSSNLLSYYETLEHLLDWCFLSLGLGSNQSINQSGKSGHVKSSKSIDQSINHPLIYTEPVYQPNYPRSRLSELSFECYQAPVISYGVDCLFAWKWNQSINQSINQSAGRSNEPSSIQTNDRPFNQSVGQSSNQSSNQSLSQSITQSTNQSINQSTDALIVSSGHSFTHVIPVLSGKPVLSSAARISIASRASQKLLESDLMNEYPHFFNKSTTQSISQSRNQSINQARVEEILERFCLFVDEYDEELKKIEVWDVNNHSVKRLINQSISQSNPSNHSSGSVIDLSMDIDQSTNQSINQSTNQSINESTSKSINPIVNQSKPSVDPITIQLPFTLPSINQPTEEEKATKEKKKKENADRLRALLAKKKAEQISTLTSSITDYETLKARETDGSISFDEYCKVLKQGGFDSTTDFEQTLLTLKRKLHRLTTGESEEPVEEPLSFPLLSIPDSELTTDQLKEKRKQKMLAGAAEHRILARQAKAVRIAELEAREKAEKEAREADPESYIAGLRSRRMSILERRKQRMNAATTQSTGSRRSVTSRKRMALLAGQMGNRDRNPAPGDKDDRFGVNDTDWDVYKQAVLPSNLALQSDEESEEERTELSLIESKLVVYDPLYADEQRPAEITERDYQIQLYVSRIRAPECLYQPSMIGVEESGLTETIRRMLSRLDSMSASRCCESVFVTGGGTLYQNFDRRLTHELTSIRPWKSTITVNHSQDSMLDAWKGAAMCAWKDYTNALQSLQKSINQSNNQSSTELAYITRAMYDECGHDYLAEHLYSNRYFPTPQLDEADAKLAKKRKR